MKKIFLTLAFLLSAGNLHAETAAVEDANSLAVTNVKNEIVRLAKSYEGQGDPDFTKQQTLDFLVEKLLQLSPQPPVKDRLRFLYGAWKQVWGPYDYRNEGRGVDPELETSQIYQVVSEDGYYYNVSPLYKDGDRTKERVGLLRGEYTLDPTAPNSLNVRFTRYPGVKPRPTDKNLWDLPRLAEAGLLENEITIVPTLIVRLFFGKGTLREVYTDANLRILYGSSKKNFDKEAIYVMTKVK